MKPVVVYVDDEIENLEVYSEMLSVHFELKTYSCSSKFIKEIDLIEFDCAILDLNMPEIGGFEILKILRANSSKASIPVFLISSIVDEVSKINAFQKGATDFFDRMMKGPEIIARMQSRIVEYKKNSENLRIGNLIIDRGKFDCTIKDEKINLTMMEFKVLKYLIRNYPRQISKDELFDNIWKEEVINRNNLNTHMFNLRLKLNDWNYEIRYSRTNGFLLCPKEKR